MERAHNRQEEILRDAFARNNGYPYKMIGDAFQVAFQNAPDAIAAAIDAQRALDAKPWGEFGPVRVRMALHTGVTEERADDQGRPGDYVGPELNRLARLLGAGHGGQVLLTRQTYETARDHLTAGITLRDLGDHHLKDLIRPERVYQLVAMDLPSDFPPLVVPDTFDLHFETVFKAVCDGRIVFFLGAGVNALLRPKDKKWQQGQLTYLPSEEELADHLAKNFGYPTNAPRDLVRVSQYISVVNGTGPLYEELHALLDLDYAPTSLHQFLAALPGRLREKGYARYPLIVTTTYDDALERAFQSAQEPFDLVTYIADGEQRGKFLHWLASGETLPIERPNEYRGLSLDQRSVILKIHGAVDRLSGLWDSFVVTEDHYINYLIKTDISNLLPVTLAAKLRKSHFLFLGYSPRDWYLRVILHRIWGEQKLTYKSWAIRERTEPLEQEFWRKREIDIVSKPLEDYVMSLSERVKELPRVGGGS